MPWLLSPVTCYFKAVGRVASTSHNGMQLFVTTDSSSSLHFVWQPGQSLTFMGTVVVGVNQPGFVTVHVNMFDQFSTGDEHITVSMYTCGGL